MKLFVVIQQISDSPRMDDIEVLVFDTEEQAKENLNDYSYIRVVYLNEDYSEIEDEFGGIKI